MHIKLCVIVRRKGDPWNGGKATSHPSAGDGGVLQKCPETRLSFGGVAPQLWGSCGRSFAAASPGPTLAKFLEQLLPLFHVRNTLVPFVGNQLGQLPLPPRIGCHLLGRVSDQCIDVCTRGSVVKILLLDRARQADQHQ
jgi:hypothetical protein